ncbi:transglycosylase SLT domain-containing protein [uncultured Rhodospira sp.]|uniref:transglycosylase SLT domain-containing protein n=1 Tax=uncultured Rhodospira sp. TaxID=1936189 RepID=UPI00262BA6C5|nr:transglycosylase SLT domain-containing protein [uncultured Rhodospira sp.]
MITALPHLGRLFVVVAVLALVGLTTGPSRADQYAYADELCYDQTSAQEQVNGIPAQVLTAISLVESGRWDERRGARIAWPWTVTNGKDGRFFPTKAEAIAHVRALQARGETNIDVGCMQINLYYHSDAFPTLEKAFEPAANVRYAVDFLTRLYAETGSWTRSVSRYHSATPVHAERYMKKFRVAWREAKDHAVVAGLPPVRDIPGRAAEIEAANQIERARLEAEHEAERAASREFAQNWRDEKLRAYLARREARAAERDAS